MIRKSVILFTTALFAIFFLVVFANAEQLTVVLNAGSYEIVELPNQLQQIKMDDFGNLLTPGNPMLPARTFLIALPPGAEVFSVNVTGMNSIELPGAYKITPAPPVAPSDHRQDLIKESMEVWKHNYESSYSSDQVYPEEVGWLAGTGGLRKYTFVRVTYTPFAYQPLSGKLIFYSSASVSIDYSLPPTGSQKAMEMERLLSDTVADELASKLFINYNEARQWYIPGQARGGPEQPYSYVIITIDNLQSAVSSLVTWKQSIGYTVNVVLVSWINSTYPGSDLPEKIRNFLIDKYQEWSIEYVLLVGDIGNVPMRYCYPKPNDPNEDTPTDYYYADLTGNWNSDGDSYYGEYGEDNVDWVPEVIVGRIPWSDATTVSNICQKIVNFEGDTGNWKDNAMLLGAISNYTNEDFQGGDRTCGHTLMELKKDFINNIGGSWTTMYEQSGINPCTTPCTAALTNGNVVSYWSGGQYGMVNWWAHGSQTTAERKWWSWDNGNNVPEASEMSWARFIGTVDCPSLNDQFPSIVFANSCNNGWPEVSNLGKNLLRQGSASIVASSRISWYSVGWQNQTWGGNASIDYFFFDYMINFDEKVGDALFDSKVYYSNNFFFPSWGWMCWQNMFDFNLYGDPALYRPGIPSVTAPITFIIDDSQFQEITDCLLMGSWDVSGVYDPNWSSGEQQMYDDGTHGDQVAGDHKWTLVLNLVVDYGANIWKWGAVDGPGGSWLIEGADQQFALPDNSPQTLTYIREGYSTPCTGVYWTLDDLVVNSGGIVTGTFPNYVTQKTIVICASDKLTITAGSVLKFVKGELRVFGTLEVQGQSGNSVLFTSNAATPAPDDWGTLHFKAGSSGSVEYADIVFGHNGIWCDGGGPTNVKHCVLNQAAYDGLLISNISSGVFENNIISNCGWSCMSLFNSSIQFRNNTVFNNGQNGIYINNVSVSDIDSNIVYNSTYDGIALYNSSPNIRYNLIYNNNDEGIDCSGSSPNIINNTIDNNGLNPVPTGYNTAGIECGESSMPVIKNNIVTNNSHHGILSHSGANPQISYNDVWGYTVSGYSGCSSGTGDISDDPRYVDPGSANYHLQATSPCIDTGDPTSPLDPDGTRADMGAYYFHQGQGVLVIIPDTTAVPGTSVDIPMNVITDVTGLGIIAAEIELSWDYTVLDNASAALGAMASGWSMSYNSAPGSGQMSIWMAGTEENPPTDDLAGTGSLVMLSFDVVGQHCDTTTIHFDKMVFNEGDPPAITHDGWFHAFAGWDITGNVYYCLNNEAVDDAIVPAVGTAYKDTTDVNGDYELLDLPPGDYVVKPEKENDLGSPSAISAFDAAWVLQYGVGLRTFVPCQMIAADVSGNGSVSAFDAAKILQWGVGIITHFPVMPDPTHFWRFVPDDFALTISNWMNAPDSIAYAPLNSNVVDDYKAILYGDVSGNWHPTDGGLAKSIAANVDIRLDDVYGKAGDKISLPINVDNASDIIAMNFTLKYDPQVLKAVGASLTSLTQDYLIAHDVKDGQIRVGLAGSHPIVGSGAIVNLEFEVLDTESSDATSLLEITELVINDGSIAANIQAARFEMGSAVPDEYALHQNYPNPFNPETIIKYQVPKAAKVILRIYNTLGHEIRTLVNEEKEAGYHDVRWDGRDDNGVMVSSGIYIYRLQARDFVSSKKMLFLR